ncbi:MAG TPA: carotenoid oxygenase family protein [Gammaproteobacteria bacterium]|nr:carotenoid oxygenase family protein [Gammaproteobacteria bacterium]
MSEINTNPFLSGNFAPVHDEADYVELIVKGKIPEELNGVYMRNGPNPAFDPISYTYPFDGDGMIHAIYLQEGRASYRNRYVKTKALQAEQQAGHAIYGGFAHPVIPDFEKHGLDENTVTRKNGAFIHIIRHANHYLAMSESQPAYEITRELVTLKEYCIDSAAPVPLGPHTRFDPASGDLFLICYQLTPPYLIYFKINAEGKLVNKVPIEKSYSTMMHDFVLTKNYLIFVDCPAVLDITKHQNQQNMLSWKPDLGTRIGIMSRHDVNQKIKWIQTDPFFVFHFANAYEQDEKIIIDYVHHASLEFGTSVKNKSWPTLHKIIIDLNTHKIKNIQLDDQSVEFPRIHENYNSLPSQFTYTIARDLSLFDNSESYFSFRHLIKYNTLTGENIIHVFDKKYEIDEAVFAPSLNSKYEDDGYLMLYVYNRENNKSEFIILDAKDFTAEPLAIIELPRRVPHGLHGSWLPDIF